MKKLFLILSLPLFFLSCKKDNVSTPQKETIQSHYILDGDYIGTFKRDTTVTNITLQLDSNKFSGTSNVYQFPAIGEGTFTIIDNDSIEFNDENYWTADFDWTLILKNKWHYNFSNDTLHLVNQIDKYTLVKQ